MKISQELQEMYKFHSWKLKNKEIMDESIGGAIQAAWNRLDPWKTQDTANKVKDIFYKHIGSKFVMDTDARSKKPAWFKQMHRDEVAGSGTTGKPGWMEIEDQNKRISKFKEKAAALELKNRQYNLAKSFDSGDPKNTRGQIKAQLKDSMLGKIAHKIDTYFNPKEPTS